MPGEFVVQVETPCAPEQAWARVWDVDAHTAVIPLTTVTIDAPTTTLAAGATFTGRTGIGPLGFDDPMRVLVWVPPTTGEGRAAVSKTGPVIGGRIEVTFAPRAEGGTRITWRQHVELPWLPSALSGLESLTARIAALGYRMILRRLLVQGA